MAHQDDMNWLRKEKLIVRLQGKEFILYAGLLALAHKHGLKFIDTDEVPTNEEGKYKYKATVEGERGRFSAHGDASSKNVGKMIVPHVDRMAETRAVARALRSYTAVGMCSLEELGGDISDTPKSSPPKRKPRAKKVAEPKPEPAPEPAQVEPAGKNGKHPSWIQEYKWWIPELTKLGYGLDEVSEMCENDGHPRPSQMTSAERARVLDYLKDKQRQVL
jgi:hypothetical protein